MSFFGLQPEDKPKLHEIIFQLVYHGQGFTHGDVYNMPIYMRNFYMQKLVEAKEAENKEMEKANKGTKPNFNSSAPNIPQR